MACQHWRILSNFYARKNQFGLFAGTSFFKAKNKAKTKCLNGCKKRSIKMIFLL